MSTADTRRRILAAAAAEFGEKGYSSATTRSIANRAVVNEVTLFRHFGSKRELLNGIIAEVPDRASLEETLSTGLLGRPPREDLLNGQPPCSRGPPGCGSSSRNRAGRHPCRRVGASDCAGGWRTISGHCRVAAAFNRRRMPTWRPRCSSWASPGTSSRARCSLPTKPDHPRRPTCRPTSTSFSTDWRLAR